MAENVKKFKTFDGVEHDLEDTQARADIADIAANTYTKTEIDGRLTGYAEKADVYDKTESYSKTEVDDALALKANAADVYTKTEVDSALVLKADVVDVYSKTETDSLLSDKADSADVYTITQTDGLLADKADAASLDDYTTKATFVQFQSDVNVEFQDRYTKSEDNALLADKANAADVYTKSEVDALIGGIQMFPKLDYANPLFTFDSTHLSYTATEDCWLLGYTDPYIYTTISIDGTAIFFNGYSWYSSTSAQYIGTNVPLTLVPAGSVITVSNTAANSNIRVFKELAS